MTPLLVIGYGNELRGDDGVGPRVARTVAEWNWPNVRALAVHQLVPELAAELVLANRVVFVDAACDVENLVSWRPVYAEAERSSMGHVSTPGWLLGVAEQAFGHAPQAWLVTIRAMQFEYGIPLSPSAEAACERSCDSLRPSLVRGINQMRRLAMHEVGLMQNALDQAAEAARHHGASRIHRLTLRVGGLAGVEPEALTFAFDVASLGTPAEGAELTIENVSVVCFCRACQSEFEPTGVIFRCPNCGDLSSDVRRGQDLELASLEVS